MTSFKKFFWPSLIVAGTLSYVIAYFIGGLFIVDFVMSDVFINFLFLVPIGVVGSLISIYRRYGLKRLRILLITWLISLVSILAFGANDDFGAIGWIPLILISTIVGTIMIFVYSARNPE